MAPKLSLEARVTIRELLRRGWSRCAIAATLSVCEGTVRYHERRAREGTEDGRKRQAQIASAHAGMCTALDALAIMWAKSMIEAPPEATESAVIERARSAVDEFMRVEGTLAPTTAAR